MSVIVAALGISAALISNMNILEILDVIQNVGEFKNRLGQSFTIPVTTISYRTFHEYFCDAHFFKIAKSACKDSTQAFVTLMNFSLHFYEGWQFDEQAMNDGELLDGILHNWLLADLKIYQPHSVSSHDVSSEIKGFIAAISDCIDCKLNGVEAERELYLLSRWGFFKNNQRIAAPVHLDLPENFPSIATRFEWNEVEVYFETKDAYVFYSWGTGV